MSDDGTAARTPAQDELHARVAERTQQLQAALRAGAAEAEERRKAEAALAAGRRTEALGRLTGGVAHDFNNLLQVIAAGLSLLRRGAEGARQETVMAAMEEALARGGRLTQQLLAFASRQPLVPERVDLAARIAAIRELIAQSLRRDIAVAITLPDSLWPVHVDGAQFDVTLLNLASNARDAMPRGGTVTLRAENVVLVPADADAEGLTGTFVRLTVSDTGIGMAPEVQARAFEPFFTTKAHGEGTGLGLSQVYGFARQSGGAARIDSVEGHGTMVALLLPRSHPAPSLAGPKPPAAAGAGRSAGLGRLRLLLVEDEPGVAMLLRALLEAQGHTVQSALSGTEALAAIADGAAPDLVISDVMMPGGMGGIDLARALRSRHPALPVVLATGYSEGLEQALAAGLPVLHKPFRADELEAMLQDQFPASALSAKG